MIQWNFPTRVLFGAGVVQKLGEELRGLGAQRVLLVADPGVVGAGLSATVTGVLAGAGVEVRVFEGVHPNPVESDVKQGSRAFVDFQAEAVVGLGGGSPLDVAKLIAVRARTARPFEELDDAVGGDRHIPADLPPIIAIPTTAGTGSEVGRAGVLTVEAVQRKVVVFAPAMLPRVALLDPQLTCGLPARTTAATGVDAITHALEAIAAKGDHPMADGIALEALRLAWRALPLAVQEPDNLDARGDMMKAAMMGAVAFQKGLGACHSLAHPLSSELGLHHGLANALCLPEVVEFNLTSALSVYERVAQLFGGVAGELPRLLENLCGQVGLSGGLAAEGVEEKHLPRLSELAFADACHRQNPRACSRADLLELYRRCL